MSLQLLADSRLVEKKTSTAEQAPANVSNDGMWSCLHGAIYAVVSFKLCFFTSYFALLIGRNKCDPHTLIQSVMSVTEINEFTVGCFRYMPLF